MNVAKAKKNKKTTGETTLSNIMNEYLSPEDAQEIVQRLESEVGGEDDTVKVSLSLLRSLYDHEEPKKDYANQSYLYLVISFHFAVIFGNFAALFLLPFVAPWYIALPLMSLIVNLMFSPLSCPLTRLESRIRKSLGMDEIRHFVKHYFIDPVRKYVGGKTLIQKVRERKAKKEKDSWEDLKEKAKAAGTTPEKLMDLIEKD